MIVLGIDPGTTRIGYGVIESSGNSLRHITSGILEVAPKETSGERLNEIRTSLERLLLRTQPEKVGIERLFFSKNKKTALSVAEARGVLVATVVHNKIPLLELSPNEVKLAVTGNGNSKKNEVAKMVSLLLHMDVSHLLDDATDALAIAIASSNKRLE